MVRRDVFLQIKTKRMISKFVAYQFESGRKSLTVQLKQKGYNVVVIDNNGNSYKEKDWPNSKTFWQSRQENLIMSDNQTRAYDKAGDSEKKEYMYLAWGING
jgi:hypothetical protein